MKSILLNGINLELFRDKSILITGGTGLIGTHLLYAFREIAEQGVKFSVAVPVHSDIPEHLKPMTSLPWLTFLNKGHYIPSDIIIHGATYGQPSKFIEHARETIYLNTTLTTHLLYSFLNPNGTFLFMSSSEVYSGLDMGSFMEDDIGTTDPYHPRACYIESKRCGETITNIARHAGIDAISARVSLAYGEGTRKTDKRALNEFIKEALLNKHIKLRDDGSAMRTYCYVGDTVNMLLKIISEGKKPVYNVGGVSSITIRGLAELIAIATGSRLDIGEACENGAPKGVSLWNFNYDMEFGPREFIPLSEGLLKTIAYQKKLYE